MIVLLRNRTPTLLWLIAALPGFCGPLQAYPLQTLTTNVQPLAGTTGGGNVFPGAVVPFGMMQWSPDTTSIGTPGGYLYTDNQILGFSLEHMSGAGCTYGGDFDFTPLLGTLAVSPCTNGSSGKTSFPSTFFHTNEVATPGYYSVRFTNGIVTELTATTRTGFGRFTYPAGATPTIVINAGSDAKGAAAASIQINLNNQEITGWVDQDGFCGSGQHQTVYFDAVFDHPFAGYGVWNGATLTPGATNSSSSQCGCYLNFNLPGGGTVLAKTAISYVSLANAQLNLQAESPASSFNTAGFYAMANAASNTWNTYLNKIQVSGGTAADTATFYTMMYRALQAPSVVSDVNNEYMGFDGTPHTTSGFTKYEFFSGWDIYRNECQFLAMMDPARAGDMAQSLVQDAEDCGAMPRWSVASGDTGVMMGDPATPIIAGMYAFGATNFDATAALAAMVRAAVNPSTVAKNGIHERDAERDYLNLGFVPEYKNGGYGPVSMTLEYDSADCALARFAQALGDTTNYILAMDRAQNWRNLFNASSGYLQMRRCDGFWSPGFVINNETYDSYQAYVEGTAAQYLWLVPFNLASLAQMMGGPQAASARLDTFFTQLNAGTASPFAYMGNEPCSEAPWIYDFLGEPGKSAGVVRQVMTQLFSTASNGFPGNDDLGQMASWYVLAALGMHPEIPGDDSLVLVGPLFPQAVIHLAGGDVTITAAGAGDDAPYIQSLTLNGQPWTAPWIRFPAIAGGGTLAFTLGTTPDTSWGADPEQAPPSYMDGMTSPMAPDYVWGTGLEANEMQPTWTNTVDSNSPPAGGILNVGPFQSGLSGPELGVRSENSQSGSDELMYSGSALGGAEDYAYMKVFDLTTQNVTVTPGMHLSYWIFPQSSANFGGVSGNNSLYVALDLIFTDGTDLRDSGLTNQYGAGVNPASQASVLALDTWNYVTVDLTPLAGKTINRIDLGYSQPNGSGGYRGYVDDIALTTPAAAWFSNNLALDQSANADSTAAGDPASNANDGSTSTRWSANDGNTNHWWEVDLGSLCSLTGDEVLWQFNGVVYDYTVAVSTDDVHWTTVVNKTANTSTAQDQPDLFTANARYVRITVTGLPPGDSASFYEFRVFGCVIPLPSPPTGAQAFGGYGSVNLTWNSSPNATNYVISRSAASGMETVIGTAAANHYLDTGLADSTTYYYVVAAENARGQSTNSNETSATTLPAPVARYPQMLLAMKPIGYWPLNEIPDDGNGNQGAVCHDYVGGNNGVYSNVVLALSGFNPATDPATSAGFGSVLSSNSMASRIGGIDFSTAANGDAEFSIVCWVNGGTQTSDAGIVAKGYGGGGEQFDLDTGSDKLTTHGFRFFVRDGSGSVHSCATAIAPGGLWHQLAAICDESNGVVRLYVDGSSVTNGTITPGSAVLATSGGSAPGTSLMSIGSRSAGQSSPGFSNQFAGKIADVAVYDYPLSASQVAALYAAASTPAIAMQHSGSGMLLNYTGTLLCATNLAGPWTTITGTSPYNVVPTSSEMFFRVMANP